MKKIDGITFVRWGSLNPMKHKEGRLGSDDPARGFHTAPCYKGIYAFPKGFVEPFLLGGADPYNSKSNGRCMFLKDSSGKMIRYDDFWKWNGCLTTCEISKEYLGLVRKKGLKMMDISSSPDKDGNDHYITYKTCKHTFEYNGNLWHHLDCKDKSKIIDSKGSWILTTYDTYVECLKRTACSDRFMTYIEIPRGNRSGSPHSHPSIYSRDHYEVFIEKLK